jgi:hypothetical protein
VGRGPWSCARRGACSPSSAIFLVDHPILALRQGFRISRPEIRLFGATVRGTLAGGKAANFLSATRYMAVKTRLPAPSQRLSAELI